MTNTQIVIEECIYIKAASQPGFKTSKNDQKDAARCILHVEENNFFVAEPTGSGKSLTYQLVGFIKSEVRVYGSWCLRLLLQSSVC